MASLLEEWDKEMAQTSERRQQRRGTAVDVHQAAERLLQEATAAMLETARHAMGWFRRAYTALDEWEEEQAARAEPQPLEKMEFEARRLRERRQGEAASSSGSSAGDAKERRCTAYKQKRDKEEATKTLEGPKTAEGARGPKPNGPPQKPKPKPKPQPQPQVPAAKPKPAAKRPTLNPPEGSQDP